MIETKIDFGGDTLANLDQARNSISGREMTRHYEDKYGRNGGARRSELGASEPVALRVPSTGEGDRVD